jgi:hypothetical protein
VDTGSVFYLAGGGLSVSGGITNDGIFKISGDPTLSVTGSFVNNGVLDLINGTSGLPANFVNNGTVLSAQNVEVSQVGISGSTFNVSIQSYPQHTYQLRESSSLTSPNWTNVGDPQTGNGSILIFSDPSATGAQMFYQIQASP